MPVKRSRKRMSKKRVAKKSAKKHVLKKTARKSKKLVKRRGMKKARQKVVKAKVRKPKRAASKSQTAQEIATNKFSEPTKFQITTEITSKPESTTEAKEIMFKCDVCGKQIFVDSLGVEERIIYCCGEPMVKQEK